MVQTVAVATALAGLMDLCAIKLDASALPYDDEHAVRQNSAFNESSIPLCLHHPYVRRLQQRLNFDQMQFVGCISALHGGDKPNGASAGLCGIVVTVFSLLD